MGRFEHSATGLSLFVGVFRVLKLPARCLSLRAIFYLNLLALLHAEALGYADEYCSSVVGFSQNEIRSWMLSVLWLASDVRVSRDGSTLS
jgi:hypothetical protein